MVEMGEMTESNKINFANCNFFDNGRQYYTTYLHRNKTQGNTKNQNTGDRI
jgi:hypothetical protein